MGTGGVADCRVSGQRLYGHKSNRRRRCFHCSRPQVGAAALATAFGLVTTVVYPASFRVPLNARPYAGLRPLSQYSGPAKWIGAKP
jgi:hypothetical protein